MADQSMWEARKAAARLLLVEQRDKHERAARRAKASVVYVDGCKPAGGTHPAIVLVEDAYLKAAVYEARYSASSLELYEKAIEELESLTYTEEGN